MVRVLLHSAGYGPDIKTSANHGIISNRIHPMLGTRCQCGTPTPAHSVVLLMAALQSLSAGLIIARAFLGAPPSREGPSTSPPTPPSLPSWGGPPAPADMEWWGHLLPPPEQGWRDVFPWSS